MSDDGHLSMGYSSFRNECDNFPASDFCLSSVGSQRKGHETYMHIHVVISIHTHCYSSEPLLASSMMPSWVSGIVEWVAFSK